MPRIEEEGVRGAFIDCRNGGGHRYGQPHKLENTTQMIQTCRRCGKPRILDFVLENGKIIDIISTLGVKDASE